MKHSRHILTLILLGKILSCTAFTSPATKRSLLIAKSSHRLTDCSHANRPDGTVLCASFGEDSPNQSNDDLRTKAKYPPPIDLIDFKLAFSVVKNLWYLPVLSILSGFTPAGRIVAESHVSRLPDTPIAHDIDTLLLWPAIGSAADRGLPPTLFQTPAAAITDESLYGVDWDAVTNVYLTNVETSLEWSGLIAVCLYLYLCVGNSSRSSDPEGY